MAMGGPDPVLHAPPRQGLWLGVLELGSAQGDSKTVRAQALDERGGGDGGWG